MDSRRIALALLLCAALAPAASARQLQVMSPSLVLRQAPAPGAAAAGRVERGAMLMVLEQRGSWFRVALEGNASAWVEQLAQRDGEMNVELFDAPAAAPASGDEDHSIVVARPGAGMPLVQQAPVIDPRQVEPPRAHLPRETLAVPDRWRLMQTLGLKFPWYDPYNQNPLKGDLPVLKNLGNDLFFNLGVISDSVLELRRVPTPVSQQVGLAPGVNNIFGRNQQGVLVQNLIVSLGLSRGNTTFRPPDFEVRFVPVFNFNRARVQEAGALFADPSLGTRRTDYHVGVQELFGDVHLRNVSVRYDFDSLRVGIQPFTNDFRGFLFQDSPFGVRLFGNRDNNRYQYNLAWFRRLEKDTNSGLNALGRGFRRDDVYLANLYRQDFPVLGFTSQLSLVHNRNREDVIDYDRNGFLVRPAMLGDPRPHKYHVNYLGYNGDGHFGRWNLSTSTYLALGHDERSPLSKGPQRIRAGFHASELSRDFSWIRVRGSLVLASGDTDPYDGKAGGFDAIVENPQIAGSDTSFAIRQAVPLIGGGGVAISGRNGILPSLRSSKDEGQSNFTNPGLALLGAGADVDLSPQLRVFGNVSVMRFMHTSSLSALRNQHVSSKSMGTDLSAGFHWRPFFTQNLIVNGSVAALQPGAGLKQLYGDKQGTLYSILFNVVASY